MGEETKKKKKKNYQKEVEQRGKGDRTVQIKLKGKREKAKRGYPKGPFLSSSSVPTGSRIVLGSLGTRFYLARA